jgi:predicted MFS family arabinose efflux permease
MSAVCMFAVLLASYAINAMDRQIFPLVAPEVRAAYGFSLADAGLLSTIFTLGMALSGLPTGYLLSRTSRKTVLQVGIAIFSLGTALTVVSRGFADMFLYRAATGVGEAMQLTTLLAIGASYFVRHRAAAVGSVNFFFGLGAIAGPALGGRLLAEYESWRVPLVVFGILGLVAIAAIAVSVRPWFSEVQGAAREKLGSRGAPRLANRNTILLTAISLLGGLIIYGYLGLYPTFLREHLHFPPRAAGAVVSMYGFGALASIGGGWLGDRFSPRLVLGGAFAGAAVLGYLLFHGTGGFRGQVWLSMLWGVVVSGILYVNLAGYHVKAVAGTLGDRASGIFVTSLYSAAAAAGYSMGWMATRAGWMLAAEIQLCAVGVLAALLALALDPARFSSSR